MLKFQATYRVTETDPNPLAMFFPGIVRPDPKRTMENTRLVMRVFELSEGEIKELKAEITDPEFASFLSEKDVPAKVVSLYLRQMGKMLMPAYELVNVIQIPEPMPDPLPTMAALLNEECNDPNCLFHKPGNPQLNNPWG